MTGRRAYFRKGVAAKAAYRPKPKRPNHAGKIVSVMDNQGRVRFMASRDAAMQRGRSKGGRTAAARGTRYCWTREQARAAALKAWRTRWKLNRRIGTRLGRPAKLATAVNHAQLREYYQQTPTLGITCTGEPSGWQHDGQPISERTALIRLGHLKPPRPRGIVPIDAGTPVPTRRTP